MKTDICLTRIIVFHISLQKSHRLLTSAFKILVYILGHISTEDTEGHQNLLIIAYKNKY